VSAAPIHVVVDCDPGIDDALALAVLAHHRAAGRLEVGGIVAVGGNVGLDQTGANAVLLAERFGLDVPVVAGAATPLAGRVAGDAAEVHGADGIGGLRTGGVAPPAAGGPGALVALLAAAPPGSERVLLATGPLTDVALALDQGLVDTVDRVVVMGGGFGSPRGNVTADAEFNVWADPEAWALVAASPLPLDVVPLDVTTRVVLDRADVAALVAAEAHLVADLVEAGIRLYEDLGRAPCCEQHDPLAAALVVEPSLVGWRSGEVAVDAGVGERRGRTDLTPGDRHRVALDVDVARARAALLDALTATAAA